MKVDKEMVAMVAEMIEEHRAEVGPIVKLVAGIVMEHGGEVKPVFDAVGDYIVERNIAAYKAYTDADIGADHATALICANLQALREGLKRKK